MIRIRRFTEDSFSQLDIPEQFFVVTDSEYHIDVGDIKKGVIEGVTGVSGSANIVLNFMGVARDLIITMDGAELVSKNDISRIMYDNPHYLVSNNFQALARIFSSRPNDYYHIFNNLFSYMQVVAKRSSDPKLNALRQTWEMRNPPVFEIEDALKKLNFRIDNMYDFTKVFIRAINSIDDEDYSGKEIIEELTYDEMYDLLYKAVLRAGEIFSDESEWVLKSNKLVLPKSTKFVIGMDKIELFNKWKNDELTPVEKFTTSEYLIERWQKQEELIENAKNNGYEYAVISAEEFTKVRDETMNTIADTDKRQEVLLNKYPVLEIK